MIKIYEISHKIRYDLETIASQRRNLTLSEHIIERVYMEVPNPIMLYKQTMHVVKTC